jgi:hypothetical protein
MEYSVDFDMGTLLYSVQVLIPATPEAIERGLTDPNPWVRLAWAEREDYQPTPRQVVRGCDDPHPDVRAAWRDKTPVELYEAYVEQGVTSH